MADEVNADIHDEHKHISFFGYFGKSSISDHLNVPNQIPFDFMHLVLQGHTKWLINEYFFKKESDCFIGNYFNLFILKYLFIYFNLF